MPFSIPPRGKRHCRFGFPSVVTDLPAQASSILVCRGAEPILKFIMIRKMRLSSFLSDKEWRYDSCANTIGTDLRRKWTLSLPWSKSTPTVSREMYKWGSGIGSSIIILHLSKLWKAKFSLLPDEIFLVRLQREIWNWSLLGVIEV